MRLLALSLRLLGRRTLVRMGGEGAPVVLIHGGGIGSSGHVWKDVAPQLAAGHRVIVPDLIGFGGSATPAVGNGLPLFVKQINELLDVLCLEKAVLVGHSMGCQVATALALQSPDRVSGLGLLAPGGGFVGLTYKSAGHEMLKDMAGDVSLLALRRYVELVNSRHEDLDSEVEERLRWAHDPDHLAAQRNLAAGRSQAGRAAAGFAGVNRLPMPIVLVWGDSERFNPAELGPQIAARLPAGSRYHLFRGAGHNIPHDCPAETAAVIADLVRAAGAGTWQADGVAAAAAAAIAV